MRGFTPRTSSRRCPVRLQASRSWRQRAETDLPRVEVGPTTRPLYAMVNRLTDVVVANSDVVASDVVREQRMSPSRVRVIRAGVDLPGAFSAAERRAHRGALGAVEGDFVVGCVGNFRSMKRQDLLIDAFASLLPEHPNLRLVLVGDGDLRPLIEQQIDGSGSATVWS